MKKILLVALMMCGWITHIFGQRVPIIDTINSIQSSNGSVRTNFIEMDGNLYFVQSQEEFGEELWISDGTKEGTKMVKDICPGPAASGVSEMTIFNGKLYFLAGDAVVGREVWMTDGTEEGTKALKDINPKVRDANVMLGGLTVVDSIMYFHADNGVNGDELWKTDGTEEGTVMVKDIFSGKVGSCPALFTNNGGEVYFMANPTNSEYGNNLGGREIWKTDGTAEGTQRVKDFGTGKGNITNMTLFNGEVYFGANDGINGKELWKTDGTADGTKLVRNIRSGSGNSDPKFVTIFNDELFFTAYTSYGNVRFLKTDGTEEGTIEVMESSYYNTFLGDWTVMDSSFYFGVSNGLYKITPGKTLATNVIGTNYTPEKLTVYEGQLYFRERGNVWVSGGTTETTRILQRYDNDNSSNFVVHDGVLHFSAYKNDSGVEIWSTDGTSSGTIEVTDLKRAGNTRSTLPVQSINNGLFIYADSSSTRKKIELLRYNNYPTSTSIFKQVREDEVAGFEEEDFSFQDKDENDSLTRVKIEYAYGKGYLFYDVNSNQRLDHSDEVIRSGKELSLPQLGKLFYQGDENDSGNNYTYIGYRVRDIYQYSDSIYTIRIDILPVGDQPKITYANTTFGKFNSEGLVVSRNEVDGPEIDWIKISTLQNGRLYARDMTTEIKEGDLVRFSVASAGLKFMADSAGIGSVGIQASADSIGNDLSEEAINYVWVDKAEQSIEIENFSYYIYSNDTLQVKAQATSGLKVDVAANGPATFTSDSLLIINGTGIISLVASQTGNRNYFPAAPVIQQIERIELSDTVYYQEHVLVSDTIFKTEQTILNDTLYLTQVVQLYDTISTTVSKVDSIFTTISQVDTLTQTTILLDTVYTNVTMVDTLFNVVTTIDTADIIPIVIMLEVPESMGVGESILLNANSSVSWPISYVVEGPAIMEDSELTITGEGEVTVNATLMTADGSQSIITLRKKIVARSGIVAGIDDGQSRATFKVYPNPFVEKVKIECDLSLGTESQLTITNSLGQKIKDVALTGNDLEVDLSDIPSGVYFLILERESSREMVRISKN